MPHSFTVNGVAKTVDVEDNMPVLWVLREQLGLLGTKFGCGVSQCGACTVLVNGEPTRSCILRVSEIAGAQLTTIEGLAANGQPHPVQQAWNEEQVPQCGYCQSGQLLLAYKLLEQNRNPSREEIDAHMSENLCRCGTYCAIRRAVTRAGALMRGEGGGGQR